MLFIKFIIALCLVAQVLSQAWHAGSSQNTILGVTVGKTTSEVYAVGYMPDVGGFLLYSADRSSSNTNTIRTGGAINMDVAISKDGNTVCVAGANSLTCGPSGANWSPVHSAPYSVVSQNVEPLGNSGFVAVGRFNSVNGIAVSSDSGETWTLHDIGASLDNGHYARYGAFPSASTFYVTTGNWPFASDAKLTNGNVARISSRLSVFYDVGDNTPQITFMSARQLLGTYPGGIWKTTDGGNTWSQVYDSAGKHYINQISCIDDNNCFAVGEDAKSCLILATTDGGANWVTKFSKKGPHSLHAVNMVSATEIFVGGGSPSIGPYKDKEIVGDWYHSTDGGATWSLTQFNGYGYDMSFKNGVGYGTAVFKKHTDIWIYQ
jgi:hypothetical protein